MLLLLCVRAPSFSPFGFITLDIFYVREKITTDKSLVDKITIANRVIRYAELESSHFWSVIKKGIENVFLKNKKKQKRNKKRGKKEI